MNNSDILPMHTNHPGWDHQDCPYRKTVTPQYGAAVGAGFACKQTGEHCLGCDWMALYGGYNRAQCYVFENLNGGYFRNTQDYSSVTESLMEAFFFKGSEKDARRMLDEINETCRDMDNADSRACCKPNFFEFELNKVVLEVKEDKKKSAFPCPEGAELC